MTVQLNNVYLFYTRVSHYAKLNQIRILFYFIIRYKIVYKTFSNLKKENDLSLKLSSFVSNWKLITV